MNHVSYHRLPWMTALSFRGPDAIRFLQSQVSADVSRLADGEALPAAWCNAQGRVLAVLWLIATADGVLAVLPRSLAAATAEGMRRFVMRSKVAVADESGQLLVTGLVAATEEGLAALRGSDGANVARLSDGRALAVGSPEDSAALVAGAVMGSEAAWNSRSASLGEAVVLPPTRGEWIPQMLNLDLIGAVSFTKGCYPGQEIVARAHHLGRVKRRMARYHVIAGPLPASGQPLFAAGEKVADVVVTAPGDPPELLAVVNLESLGRTLTDASGSLVCAPRPLPYPLPELRAAG
jgi:folate-binding protein YgfZ